MLNDNGGTLRVVAWSEICPWLSLVRCFRLAIRFRLLVLAAIAILLTVLGWAFFGLLLSADSRVERQVRAYEASPWTALTVLVPDKPYLPKNPFADGPAEPESIYDRGPEPFWGSFIQLSRPVRQMFDADVSVVTLAFLVLCSLWTVAVWAFFGGAITRVAAVELAREERVGWGEMVRFAGSRWVYYFAAPLAPLAAVLVGSALIGILGIFFWSDVTLLLAALILPVVLLVSWLMVRGLLGLLFGWPLMWPAISAEGEDSFDALSRSYEYFHRRPLHYLFYAVVAGALGWLGWIVVSNVAAGMIALTSWAVDWGADTSRWVSGAEAGSRQIRAVLDPEADISGIGWLGAKLILFWFGCIKLLAVGYLYSYFWTASTAIYFLLRRDADATEMDEVFVEEDEEEPSYGLPPLATDEAGAPVVADDTEPPHKPAEEEGEAG